jgi:hypothetical protein
MSEEIHEVLICKPLASPGYVVPGSVLFNYGRCGQIVTVSPSSMAILRDKPGMRIICWFCGVGLMKEHPGPVEPLTPAQQEEIREAHYYRRN